MTFVLLILSTQSFSADYDCSTEFGETVPVDLTVKGEKDARFSWNPQIVSDTTLRAAVKDKEQTVGGKKAILRTRYAHQKGPDFSFRLKCSAYDKCDMHFLDAKKGLISNEKYELTLKAPRIYDERLKDNGGHASIMIARRDHKGFIVRVFKNKIPVVDNVVTQTSSSGEIKIFSEEQSFSLDVGTDEQLQLDSEERIRLAAMELKIECEKRP